MKEKLQNMGLLQEIQPTNQIIAKFDYELAKDIVDKFQTELWNKGEMQTTLRFVVSFKTTKRDIDILTTYLANAISRSI